MSEVKSTERTSLASRVRAGVALLDEREPGWHNEIYVPNLDVGSCVACVLGQLYDRYSRGLEILDLSDDESFENGFNGYDGFDNGSQNEMRGLTRLWSFVIRQRQAVSQ